MELKAIVCKTTVKHKRKDIVKVSQFCNDWFMLEDASIANPVCLAFTPLGIATIIKSNPGIMFKLYDMVDSPEWCNEYTITFKRKRYDRGNNQSTT